MTSQFNQTQCFKYQQQHNAATDNCIDSEIQIEPLRPTWDEPRFVLDIITVFVLVILFAHMLLTQNSLNPDESIMGGEINLVAKREVYLNVCLCFHSTSRSGVRVHANLILVSQPIH